MTQDTNTIVTLHSSGGRKETQPESKDKSQMVRGKSRCKLKLFNINYVKVNIEFANIRSVFFDLGDKHKCCSLVVNVTFFLTFVVVAQLTGIAIRTL